MAPWKARVEFLLSVNELLFLSLTVEALQDKVCQNSLPSGGGRSLGAKISGGRGRPWGIFLVSTKLDTFCYPTVQSCKLHHATCRRFDTIPACERQTDRQTDRRDGIAVASTALAMRALRPAVKTVRLCYRTVVCPVCPALSVTLMYCGQTVGWIKMKHVTQVSLGPKQNIALVCLHYACVNDSDAAHLTGRVPRSWPHCVTWEPSSPPQRGTAPNFWPISVVAKWLDGSRRHLVGR